MRMEGVVCVSNLQHRRQESTGDVCSTLFFSLGQRRASLVTQMVKNLLAMQEVQVRSLGREDPLEEGMATHSRILAWRIPWTEEPGWLQAMGVIKNQTRMRGQHTGTEKAEKLLMSITEENWRNTVYTWEAVMGFLH